MEEEVGCVDVKVVLVLGGGALVMGVARARKVAAERRRRQWQRQQGGTRVYSNGKILGVKIRLGRLLLLTIVACTST